MDIQFKGENEITLQNDEYIQGERVYCKICQGVRAFKREGAWFRCMCDCDEKKAYEQAKAEEQRKKNEQFNVLQATSLLGKRYFGATFEATDVGEPTFKAVFDRCKKYCEVSESVLKNGHGIYLYGQSGTGKTHLTACMANELMKKGYSVLFTNFFEILRQIKASFKGGIIKEGDLIEKLTKVDFLFLDDFGTESFKKQDEDSFYQEKIYDILNKRYNQIMPTVFTSNYSMRELVEKKGVLEKTVQRMAEMTAKASMRLDGDNCRKRKSQESEIEF